MHFPKNTTLTLVLYTALALVLSAHASLDAHHAPHKRIVKKRAPQAASSVALQPLVGAQAEPTAQPATTSPATTTTPTPVTTTTPATTTTTPGGLLDSLVPSLSNLVPSLSTETSSSTSVATTVSSSSVLSTSTSSSVATTPSTTAPTTTAAVAQSTMVVKGGQTSTVAVNAAESSAPPAQTGAAATKSKTLTILIALAASVGGVAIIWTIFRKWKLSRSSKSDSRMQPIDWQPTNQDDGLPGAGRRASGSSFRSGFSHSEHGHGYGSTSDNGHANRLGPLPDHDFTAGTGNLAPVGGYADLARGPSPQPQMESLNRGPSLTRPQYETAVPLHHQAGGYSGAEYGYNGARY